MAALRAKYAARVTGRADDATEPFEHDLTGSVSLAIMAMLTWRILVMAIYQALMNIMKHCLFKQ